MLAGQGSRYLRKRSGIGQLMELKMIRRDSSLGVLRLRIRARVISISMAGIQLQSALSLKARALSAVPIYWAMGGRGHRAGSNLFPASDHFHFIRATPRTFSMANTT